MRRSLRIAMALLAGATTLYAGPPKGVEQVVILGVDGLSPAGIQMAETPTFNRLLREGAFHFHARAVLTTSSSQNWASMIMGAGPEQHGITSNGWERDAHELPPTMAHAEGIFPTIFSILREAQPTARIGVFYDWGGFGRLFQQSTVDVAADTPGPDSTMAAAIRYLRSDDPDLVFIHLDHVDHAGHAHGHLTEHYFEAVEHTDRLLADLLEVLDPARSVLIVTSDHGGIGHGHGGETLDEVEIPWLAHGRGVRAGKQLTDPVDTYDTAATAAWLLGVKPPYAWIARPVVSAFTGNDDQMRVERPGPFVPRPRIVGAGRSVEELADSGGVRLYVDRPGAVVRYSLDGSDPTAASPAYATPLMLDGGAEVRARAFDGKGVSDVSRSLFTSQANGVRYRYFELPERHDSLPDFAALEPAAEGQATDLSLGAISHRSDDFAVEFTTWIHQPVEQEVTFHTLCDDGAQLFVDGQLVVDANSTGGARFTEGSVLLTMGWHELRLAYFETYGDNVVGVYTNGPDGDRRPLPVYRLFLERP